MEINWFTVIAQVVNFLILVWLLKRFLYKPVLNAIDEREKKIAAQLNDAEAKKAEAQKERDLFQQKNESFDKERSVMLHKARQEASEEKEHLLDEARAESDALRARYETSLQQEQQNLTDTVKRKIRNEVFAIAAKTLSDLASASLDEQLVRVFTKRIGELTVEEKADFKKALGNVGGTVIVKTAVDLSASSTKALEECVKEVSGVQNIFQYQLSPELVSGIEIESEKYNLSWNIESYLEALQTTVTAPVNGKIKEQENATL